MKRNSFAKYFAILVVFLLLVSARMYSAAPAAPTLSLVSTTQTQINLSWNVVSGATNYTIYQDGSSIQTVTTNNYSAGVSCGTTHSYYVKAGNPGGTSGASNTVSGTAIMCSPTLSVVSTTQTQINLSWNFVFGATNYTIYQDGSSIQTVTTNNYSAGVSCGTTHSYYVKAGNPGGSSPASNTVSGTALPCTYALIVTATNGYIVKNPDLTSYNSGTTVQLTATPATGYAFTGWSGDTSGTTNPITIIMNRNKTITANFTVIQLPKICLSTTSLSGPYKAGTTSFTITNCGGGTLSWNVASSDTSWLKVSPKSGTNTGTVTVTYTKDTTARRTGTITVSAAGATNTPQTVTMTQVVQSISVSPSSLNVVNTSGSQSITISCSGGGSLNWNIASSDTSWLKVSPISGTNTGTVTVTYTTNSSTTAKTGKLTVSASNAINTPQYVTVTQQGALTLSLSATTGGTVAKNPDQTTYNYGTSVVLIANPLSGYTFTGWSGDTSGTANSITVTMNRNKNITANFSQGFKIVFSATLAFGKDTVWLNKIKQRWGATGISLEAHWGDIETQPNQFYWNDLDTAIATIKRKGLDVYVRACMGYKKPTWVAVGSAGLTDNDFQITSDGKKFKDGDSLWHMHPLNFVSSNSKYYLFRFYSALLHNLQTYYPNSINEVVPSVSTAEEMEFPFREMCGYSSQEILLFMQYLQTKYSSKDSLNRRWGSSFSNIDTNYIKPRLYNWQNPAPYGYTYDSGRVDWMEFRTTLLKSFIDSCASLTHSTGLKIGLQLGSIYDESIQNRGWWDATSLVENVDAVHVADVIDYKPNFLFASDYLRSICAYWSRIKNKPINFSTETDWPDYGQNGIAYPSSILSKDWTNQLTTYYGKGSNAHYVFGWAKSGLDWNSLETDYSVWRSTLLAYSNAPKCSVSYLRAVHLSCEEGNILGLHPHQGGLICYTFYYDTCYFLLSISSLNQYAASQSNYGDCDIITNFMISNTPTYLNYYTASAPSTGLCFTQSSYYIPDKVYLSLMRSDITISMANATCFSDNGHGEFAVTSGLKNEYNDDRSPIHLIWRTRSDLQAIWDSANVPKPGSGHTEDFVSWAFNSGCGYANQPSAREYPGWEIRDNGVDDKYKFDKNIRAVWNGRSPNDTTDLGIFLQGYANKNNTWNIISWAKSFGYLESSLLQGYNHWPYIGDASNQLPKQSYTHNSISNPIEFRLSQNYPNPFNPISTIKYQLPKDGLVTLKVYDILGREVAELVNEMKQAGYYQVDFNASKLASGIYIYRISVNGFVLAKKMLLIK